MTRKDYQVIVEAIKDTLKWVEDGGCDCQKDGVIELADRLAEALAKDNPRFDMAKFLIACKPGKEQ